MIEGKSLPTLEGRRIALRALEERDVFGVFEIFSDSEVLRYWSHEPFASQAQAAAYVEDTIQGFADKSFFQWGVAHRSDDTLLGTCTLWQLDEANRRSEIGFALGRRHWGQGFMSEALGTLFDFAFGDLGLRRLEADVDPENGASIALLEKLGFEREGYLRERWRVAGKVADSLLLGLLARDWRNRD